MVDETNNQTEATTPQFPTAGEAPPDSTVRLDAAIGNGNLPLPTGFGRYRVAERIGIGGFASVYSAFDPELDSLVAVKVLAENHSANVAVRKRFVAEARVARRLGSDRLISVFDLGETDDGRPYVVMELAERGTLRQRLVRTGRPTPDDLLRLIEELAACMAALHAQGVVHRDIKPSNVLFRPTNPTGEHHPTKLIHDDERLVLGDLGLARDISAGASSLTVGGGTEGYMAPEQADPRGKADYRADIYSATAVLAELTTGRHPQRLDLPSADISTGVLEALTVSLSFDRDQRPPTASAWRDQLVTAYTGQRHVGGEDAPTGPLVTAYLDATEVQAPYPSDTDVAPPTDIPPTGLREPQLYDKRPSSGHIPPPPPSLPIDPGHQPPPPKLDDPQAPDRRAATGRALDNEADPASASDAQGDRRLADSAGSRGSGGYDADELTAPAEPPPPLDARSAAADDLQPAVSRPARPGRPEWVDVDSEPSPATPGVAPQHPTDSTRPWPAPGTSGATTQGAPESAPQQPQRDTGQSWPAPGTSGAPGPATPGPGPGAPEPAPQQPQRDTGQSWPTQRESAAHGDRASPAPQQPRSPAAQAWPSPATDGPMVTPAPGQPNPPTAQPGTAPGQPNPPTAQPGTAPGRHNTARPPAGTAADHGGFERGPGPRRPLPPSGAPGARPASSTPRAPGRGPTAGTPVAKRPRRAKRKKRKASAQVPTLAPPVQTAPPPARTAPPPVERLQPPPDPAEASRQLSKKHLKTAERLAKLERRHKRKLARKARRRRRRLRVANFFLSLIRGMLAALIAWFSGLIVAAAAMSVSLANVGEAIDARPGAQVLLSGTTFLAFLWGLAYFPFPRSYEI